MKATMGVREEIKELDAIIERQRQALLRIAFGEGISCLSGDPSKWPSTIAYRALGGRSKNGHRIDSREDLA